MMRTLKLLGGIGLLLGIVALLAVGLPGSAQAAEFKEGETVIIAADEVIDDDLFVTGNRVEINGTVAGDLLAAGTEIIINGTVEGSTFIGAQSAVIDGTVDGSVYAATYSMTLDSAAEIGRNVFYSGFSLTTEDGSTVGRGLYSSGYQIIHNGDIAGDAVVAVAAFEVNGTVGGDVTASVGNPDEAGVPPFMPNFPGAVAFINPGFRQGEGADIAGELDVTETDIGERPRPNFAAVATRAVGERLGEFIAILLVGGLLLRFWPVVMLKPQEEARERPLPSAGVGCLVLLVVLIAVPLVALLIIALAALFGLVTLGQLFNNVLGIGMSSLALFVTAFIFVVSFVTKAVVAYLTGRWTLDRVSPETQPSGWREFGALALGALIYEILRIIPILGPIVAVVVIIVGLGAIFFALRARLYPPSPEADLDLPAEAAA